MDKLDFTFLPESVSAPLSRIGTEKLYEIRMRAGAPVVVNHDNKRLFLGRERLTIDAGRAIFCDRELIEETLFRAADYSLYAANESLKSGFVTTRGGVRVGVCGECVFDGKNIVTIKNFTSLCIRIPHFIEGAANELIRRAFADGVKNTLIVSAPGYGKTTILKDLCRVFAENYNVLVIDERGELEDERLAKADIVKFSDKLYAFQYGIRSLAPQIVMTDELSGKEDWECVRRAVNNGVKIIATAHGDGAESIQNRPEFLSGLFERYVVLRSQGRAGCVEAVYDGDFYECR